MDIKGAYSDRVARNVFIRIISKYFFSYSNKVILSDKKIHYKFTLE